MEQAFGFLLTTHKVGLFAAAKNKRFANAGFANR